MWSYPTPQGEKDIYLGGPLTVDNLEEVFEICQKVARANLAQKMNWQGFSPEQEEELDGLLELGLAMCHTYMLWHKRVAKFKVIASEVPFSVPLYDYRSGNRLRATYDGHIDFVMDDTEDLRDPNLWLGEYKSVAQMRDPERLQFDEQWTSYIWAKQQEQRGGDKKDKYLGVVYIELRKKKPRIPDIVYQGKRVSCNKATDTTPDVWLETVAQLEGWEGTLEELEQNIHRRADTDYIAMLDNLYEKERQGKGYVRITWVRHSQAEIDHVGKSIVHEYYDMRRPTHIVPTPTWDCTWRCDFKEVCLALNDGVDITEYLYGTGEYVERIGYYGDVRDE